LEPIISIIIPTHNSEQTLKKCLNSLSSQSLSRQKYEILVVDDGSTDQTIKIAKKCDVDSVISTEHCFQGKARNIGVKNSHGKLLAFIDSDCIAEENWLTVILAELSKLPAISGSIENGVPDSPVAWSEYCLEFGGLGKQKPRSTASIFSTCNGACTKESFQKSGGFEESESSEDFIFILALKNAGIPTLFVPEMKIQHLCRTSMAKVLKNMEKLGNFFVLSRQKNSSLPHTFFLRNRLFIPFLFFAKIYKSSVHAIDAKIFRIYLSVLPMICKGSLAFCCGVWKEVNKK